MLSRHVKWITRALIGIALAGAIWLLGAELWDLRRHVVAALNIAYRFEDMATSLDPAKLDQAQIVQLRDDLGVLEQDLRTIESKLAIPMAFSPYLGWVPRVGPSIKAAPDLLSLAINSAAAGWWALLGAEPLIETFLAHPEQELSALLSEAVASLGESAIYFREAEEAMSRALDARSRFESAVLIPRLAGILERLDPYLPLAQMGLRGLLIAPTMLGARGQQTYLLLAQNSHELRPTGGLISGVGTLSVDGGQIGQVALLDSYRFDNFESKARPPAPAPLAKYMWAGVLSLRDANWSPHFPASAQVIASLYQLSESDAEIDGIIAADLQAVELFLDALGPVRPAGYEQPISAANVIALLQQYWSAPVDAGTVREQLSSDWWAHRKDIMQDLLQAMLDTVQRGAGDLNLRGLLFAARDALAGRHVLLYARDAAVARDLSAFGWDGAIQSTDSDYLMVIDANLGFNKLDANMKRRIDYRIQPDSDRLRGQVTMTYVNTSPPDGAVCRHEDLFGLTQYQAESYEDLTEGCYWDYVRLYVPVGSELISVDGLDEPADMSWEESKAVFGGFFVVPPGQTREVRFSYRLSDHIVDQILGGEYDLLVQKQAGTGKVPLRVAASLPSGVITIRREQGNAWISPAGWDYETLLETDRRIHVQLRKTNPGGSVALLALVGLALIGAGVALRGRHPARLPE